MAVVRIDRLKAGLYAALSAELDPTEVQWGYSNIDDDELPAAYCSLSILRGPVAVNQGRARSRAIQEPTTTTITIAAPDAGGGELVTAWLNLQRYAYTTAAGDTAQDARDALLALLGAESGAVVVTNSTDKIDVSPAGTGTLWDVRAAGLASAVTTYSNLLSFASGRYLIEIQLDAYARPPLDAADIAGDAYHALLTEEVSSALFADYGVSLGRRNDPPLNNSAIAGGLWESRYTFRFETSMVGGKARALTPIESLDVSITGNIATVQTLIALSA